jgi:hypothetical protein
MPNCGPRSQPVGPAQSEIRPMARSPGVLQGGAAQGEAERGSPVSWGDGEAACSGGSAAFCGGVGAPVVGGKLWWVL